MKHTRSNQASMRASRGRGGIGTGWVATAFLSLLIPASAQATMIQYHLCEEFSDAYPPEGAAPWLTVTLDDGDTSGSVDLLLEATNLTDNEFVFEWLLNFDAGLELGNLQFSAPTKTGWFTDPTIETGINTFKADGDGYFDIRVVFDNSDGGDKRFGVADAVAFTITSTDSITADSFDFASETGGAQGIYPTAAHVGGIGPDDANSGWISTPEPASLFVLALGGLAWLSRSRR
jgi:hypothetical protein